MDNHTKDSKKSTKHQFRLLVAKILCGNYMHKKKKEANVKTRYEFGKWSNKNYVFWLQNKNEGWQ